jgi:DNA polymerase III delta prime subunit
VYAFAESLRIMMGVWTREAAIRDFRFRRFPKPSSEAEDSLWKHLHERGDNWREKGEPSVAEKLTITFIHPTCVAEDSLDPDSPPIPNEHARSAILFGPPGTSKTTIVEAVAKILGWDFIEIHSSDFLADGMQQVHRTADRIFKRLMNLDRCVILFDEIDELVRQRDDGEADSFGRFLTTAMLPKIAELWKRRRTLFFLATNHIKSFDDAIIRSERFDNLIFVSPPSFDRKKNVLCQELKTVTKHDWTVIPDQQGIDNKIQEMAKEVAKAISDCGAVRSSPIADTYRPAQLAVLRYDQLSELAHNIAELPRGSDEITEQLLIDGLKKMRDQRSATKGPYADILGDRQFERRDHRMQMYWQVIGFDGRPGTAIHAAKGKHWYKTPLDIPKERRDEGFTLKRSPDRPGTLTFISTTPPSPGPDPGSTPSEVALQQSAAAIDTAGGRPPSQPSITPFSSSPVAARVPTSESAAQRTEAVNEIAAHDGSGRSDDGEQPSE